MNSCLFRKLLPF